MTEPFDLAEVLDDDEIEELTDEELAELVGIGETDRERKQRIDDYVQMMKRPESVLESVGEVATAPANTEGGDSTTQENTEGGDSAGTTAGTTESSTSTGKINIPIFDFLEVNKIPDWYNAFLIFTSELAHDKACNVEALQDERKQIFTIVSTKTDLTPEQREFYQKRYDLLESLINERVEGRKTLAQRLEISKGIKEKFAEALKKYLESIQFNFELTPLQMVLAFLIGGLIYAAAIVSVQHHQYSKP